MGTEEKLSMADRLVVVVVVVVVVDAVFGGRRQLLPGRFALAGAHQRLHPDAERHAAQDPPETGGGAQETRRRQKFAARLQRLRQRGLHLLFFLPSFT